ncbi:hypothetical protein GPJ56_000617 [Histomonas meleagridis]|uniref:uncharacterized protein n=1 Tax=Histomonas meleagridis TaxID=135588 RepID=UPI00355998BB|nr:hypothetical protein GPJ56_000617 [Histomonas meleagridis]KAH0804744.1 hypothetical protein GO595_002438 [Histomonas meleagridis]
MSSFAERRALLARTFQTPGPPPPSTGGGPPPVPVFVPGMPMPGSNDEDEGDTRRPPPKPVVPTYTFPEVSGSPSQFKKSKKEYPSKAKTGTEGCNDFHSYVMENSPSSSTKAEKSSKSDSGGSAPPPPPPPPPTLQNYRD